MLILHSQFSRMKENQSLVEQTQRDILKYIPAHPEIRNLPKQDELVKILGVSRVVVREATSRLQALGFIETRRKKGSTVVLPKIFSVVNTIVESGLLDKNTLRDLYQLRLMLEIGMADFIFLNNTEKRDYHTRNVISHVGLFNQVRSGNPESFRTAMRLHLQTQFKDMEVILEKVTEKTTAEA